MVRQQKSYYFVFIAVVFLLSVVANPLLAQSSKIVIENVAYHLGDTTVTGYLARPDDNNILRPAVVMIHEWWGLDDHIKDNARRYAQMGYVTLAVDLYHGKVASKPEDAQVLAVGVSKYRAMAMENLKHAVRFLKSRSNVDPNRVASIGWCFGGGWSYQMAKNDLGVKATVIYYGFFNPKDDLSKMRASIIGHFAEKDRGIKVDNVREFQVKLKTLNGDHEVYIYPNTSHAFANPNRNIYDQEASELAWERTHAFLNKHL